MRYFSPSTGFFYDSVIHGDNIPADVTSEDEWEYSHAQLFAGQAAGKEIVGDASGCPVLADRAIAPVTAEQIWQQIKAERNRRRFDGGVKVGAHWYLSNAVASSEYTSLALLSVGMPDETVLRADWRTMDGATVDMTPLLVRQILVAGFASIAAIDDAAQAHRAAMEASPVPGDYDFSGGWPATFEG